jgi:hypothetical protein
VDYGSNQNYSQSLKKLASNYSFIELIFCPVEGQLWNKSRAINIALKISKTPYFLVADVDLVFHRDFIEIITKKASPNVIYFMCGFLSEKESLIPKKYEDYKVDFLGGEEVTGITLFPADRLKEVNGYDEFYHGWGAEDTDIHFRIKETGLNIEFYNNEVLVKHQWHPKEYRSKLSSNPLHSNLERLNYYYLGLTRKNKRSKVNLEFDWGQIPKEKEYKKLMQSNNQIISINPIDYKFFALLAQLKNYQSEVVRITIKDVHYSKKCKQLFKRILNKKYLNYMDMEKVNNLLLEEIIKYYRNNPYIYKFDRTKGHIDLTIFFKR